MPDATQLVTAPFIQIKEVNGRSCFVRADPNGRRIAVPVTKTSQRLLNVFSLGGQAQDVAPNSASAVQRLQEAELLVEIPVRKVPPPSLEIELTNRCNAVCVMCPREELRPLGLMAEDVFRRILALLDAYELPGVSLQGIGEPTLHPSLVSWVSLLRKVLEERPIMMVTNGFLMDPERVGRLREAGLSHLQWSYHSTNRDLYNRIMGVDAFDEATERLRSVVQAHGEIVSVNMVVMEANKHETDTVRQWLESVGLPAKRLCLIPCFSRGGHLDTVSLGGERNRRAGRCLYLRKAIFIAWNGDVLPCSSDIPGAHVLGNVRTLDGDDLLAGWRSRLARAVRYDMCRTCDHFTRDSLETTWFDRLREADLDFVGAER